MKKNTNLKFQNDRFKCRCSNGRCSNYKAEECGKGGKVIDPELGYDAQLMELKKSWAMDHTFGRKYQTEKNKRSRNKKRQEKRNGK